MSKSIYESLEENQYKMPPALKRKLQKELATFIKNPYFDKIPLGEIQSILNDSNVLLVQEDGTEWSGFLCGNNARETFDLADPMKVLDEENKIYQMYTDTMLFMSWYKMSGSGRYEINLYLT